MHPHTNTLRSAEWCWIVYFSSACVKVSHLSFHSFITTCKGKHYLLLALPLQMKGEREREIQYVVSEIPLSLYIHPSPFSLVPLSLNLSSISIPITLYRFFFPLQVTQCFTLPFPCTFKQAPEWCKHLMDVMQERACLGRYNQEHVDSIFLLFLLWGTLMVLERLILPCPVKETLKQQQTTL